ncbi:MAG: molecular chaperone HtpG [Clostridiales bacterium]|nr:molecular chaperone HtpG [Clostridiales bacterium]
MSKQEFKAESKKLLDMMINSIYTHKEIFLREIISNASDAIDKLYYMLLEEKKSGLSRDGFGISIAIDKDARTLTVSDNGIGMTRDELETNLGTIAKSGSFDFKKENEAKEDIDIIGQFGVGFYSAFMVSDHVEVLTKKYGSDSAYRWISEGADGYQIDEAEKDGCGTDIILHIKEDTDEEKYDDYINQYKISALVKKYSDYITYPITMDFETSRPVENGDEDAEPEYETVIENRTLNSMVPIWKKNKADLTDDDYNSYYKEKFYDFSDPVCHIHTRVEGQISYDALLYVPSKAAYDYYTKDFKKGLALYTNGVMIMEKCEDLLPDYFNFVAGVVDSADLSLNISRELLQHDRQLKLIAKNIEKKITSELLRIQSDDREKYMEFFRAFGVQLKFGIYNSYGMNKDKLQDLLVYLSSEDGEKGVTLKEYVMRMKEDQEHIYYASGDTIDKIKALPQAAAARDKGYEVLYMTDNVDEFTVQMMGEYDGKTFMNINASEFDLSTEEEKEAIKKENEDFKAVLDVMKGVLGDKVRDVRFTNTLAGYPVCLSNEGEISIEMEKTLNAMPVGEKVKADLVLEINSSHDVAAKIKALESDEDRLKELTEVLYDMAKLISGLTVDDPGRLSELVCKMM